MRDDLLLEMTPESDPFQDVTEEDIICLWHSFKASGLSGEEAWHAILTGIALDMAFERSKSQKWIEQ